MTTICKVTVHSAHISGNIKAVVAALKVKSSAWTNRGTSGFHYILHMHNTAKLSPVELF